MRHIKRVALLIVAPAAFLVAQIDPPGRVGRLNYMDGAVSFQPAGLNDWEDATVNRPLIPGDTIWVGDRGRSELHVGSTALRLGPNTAFQFLNLDDQTVQIRLSQGTLTVRLRNIARNQAFEIDTPNLALTLVRSGDYRIDANPDSQTTVITVRDGEGEVTSGAEAFPVYARQQVIVRGDDQITYSLSSSPGADAWDQWCSSRDRREDQSQSARYVSREVTGYDDLDQYGRWGDQPGYGNVWMPTSVAAGWAPYRDGHWAWIAPWGWTWVDDAPWGFAPYHYGRWATFGGRWGWIPGPYGVTPVYAPALVAWIGGGSGFSLSFSIGTAAAVGWFPLGPREPYYPSYQSSRGYFTRVNNTNTVINNTTINNYYDYSRNSNNTAITNIKYVNRNVQNGVTAVPQDTFARGRRAIQDARAVPSAQLASVQVFAAPAIAPQRESVLGSRADTASRAPRPPANALSRPVVARTAPPPVPVPFERQQPALAKNPGRPLPPTQVQQIRQVAPAQSAPVRVVDMGRVKRVQPAVGRGAQAVPPQIPVTQPPVTVQPNVPREQQKQQDVQRQQQQKQQDIQRQQQEKQQQDVQRQQQQKQQDTQRQQQEKQQQDIQRQQQQKQQDIQRQQQEKQQQDVQRQQQQKQQDIQRQQQEKQQQDVQRQQQQKQQDIQRQQQEKQQQDIQRQQQQKQQDIQRQQQEKQQQDIQRQQQQKQQDIQRQQQEKQQQDIQRQQQQKQQQDIQRQQQQKQQDIQPQQQQKQQQDVQRQQQQKQQQRQDKGKQQKTQKKDDTKKNSDK